MSAHNVRLLSGDEPDALALELKGADSATIRQVRRVAQKQRQVVAIENVTPEVTATLSRVLGQQGNLVVSHRAVVILSAESHALRCAAGTLATDPDRETSALAEEIAEALDAASERAIPTLGIRGQQLDWGSRTYVMGVVNVTPDSFSGDGILERSVGGDFVDAAVALALGFIADGADIIDVGGESTRPGAEALAESTEADRVLPVVGALRAQTDAIISIDTYKASVAERALDAGADMVNDVWGLAMDPDMAPLVAARGIPVVLMHNRSKPKSASQEARLGGRYVGVHYDNLMADVLRELRGKIDLATTHGIPQEHIIVDPGIGFGKTVSQNLYLLNHLDSLRVLRQPILLGPSRKSFIGYTLDLPSDQRMEGTAAAVAIGILRGANIVRVHDVRAMARVARMVDAITRATPAP